MKEKTFFDNWQNKIVDAKTGDLKFHINSIHKKQNIFQCEICEKSFAREDTLRTHNFLVHVESPIQHECDICPKKYLRMNDLKNHIKHVLFAIFC